MSIKLKKCDKTHDFKRVGEFLVEHYQPGNSDGNFLLPAWEYMCTHPMTDVKIFDSIGVWEDAREIVGIAHAEMRVGEAFFEIHPRYTYLKPEMLAYAEEHLRSKAPDGRDCLLAFVNDFDTALASLVKAHGYEIFAEADRPMTQLPIPQPFPPIHLPDGFFLKSLADENDLAKLDRCIYRGFNHGDEPLLIDYAGRKKQQTMPGYRKDLNIIIVAPDGNYIAYAGLWFEAKNKFAYVEPVCTDPDYRRIGFASAAMLEGIRRCGELGATIAYVGSVLPLYQSLGFRKLFVCNCWRKFLDH